MAENKNNRRTQSLIQVALFIGILIFINILANARINGKSLYAYLDLTEEKRFSLTEETIGLLEELDDEIFVEILLEGEFPAGFKRLQTSVRDMLEDFRSESGYIEYNFIDPGEGSVKQVNERREALAKEGIVPISLRLKDANSTSNQLVYPYAVFRYGNKSWTVNLLENEVPGMSNEIVLNNSVGLLEYKFASAIQKVRNSDVPTIVFTKGHGELSPFEVADLEKTLREYNETGHIYLDSIVSLGKEADLVIVAKPQTAFSEKDKFKLDQYVMNGGRVIWLIDQVAVTLDSLQGRNQYFPSEYELNIDDMLFRYGIRIQSNMLLDMQCTRIPLATGYVGNAPQFDNFRYPYHLVITPNSDHPIVKSVGPVNMYYASSIDTEVETKFPIEKTVLLTTSNNSRYQRLPIGMDFDFLRYDLDAKKFDKGPQPIAMLLEGKFNSLYENKVSQEMLSSLNSIGIEFKK
jgi:ABC-2 type transport system permease protein